MANGTLTPLVRRLWATAGAPDPAGDAQLLARFRTRRDGAAFAALVRRHGPAVLAACRRVLDAPADVEDAFQTTFLTLLRKAGTIRRGRALGGWLACVAHRTAVQAARSARSRQRRERLSAGPTDRPPVDLSWREAVAALHEELDRLPERFRRPVLLCYLDGKSRDEAAVELGWSLGTLRGRLERGRALLRARLARRGIAPAVALFVLGDGAADTAVPAGFVATVTRWVLRVVGPVVLLALAAVAGLPGRPADPPAGEDSGGSLPRLAAPAEPTVTVAGRVVDAAGQPVAGAKLFIVTGLQKTQAPQPAAGDDGSFRFALGANPLAYGGRSLFVTADGHGCGWASLIHNLDPSRLTVRLPDDLAIEGRVIDLEGRPVRGATVSVREIHEHPSGSLGPFFRSLELEKDAGERSFEALHHRLLAWDVPDLLPPVATDADGRFTLRGVGRERGVPALRVSGGGVAVRELSLVTRAGFDPDGRGSPPGRLFGPRLTVVVTPARPIIGVVRDRLTGQPVPGVRVVGRFRAAGEYLRMIGTVTDAAGRYRLDELPKADRRSLAFDPVAGTAHVHRFIDVADSPGLGPITADVELERGLMVQGRVTDRVTGAPVRGYVIYQPFWNNETAAKLPGYNRASEPIDIDGTRTDIDRDGGFRLTALPGPGILFVRAWDGGVAGRYLQARLAPEDNDPALFDPRFAGNIFRTNGIGGPVAAEHVNAYRIIRPAADAREFTADFTLVPGRERKGVVVDPEGRPVAGTWVSGLHHINETVTLPGSDFTAVALDPEKPRRLLFWNRERKLCGSVMLSADAPEPVTVKLEPCGAVTGRVVRADGQPVVGVRVRYSFDHQYPLGNWTGMVAHMDEPIVTDAAGRFRIEGVPSGLVFGVGTKPGKEGSAGRGSVTLRAGEEKDLGDLTVKPE